jgi:prophage regulatory protein
MEMKMRNSNETTPTNSGANTLAQGNGRATKGSANCGNPKYKRLVRLTESIGDEGLLPISRATFYGYIQEGRIPKPIKLGERISAWREQDILDFINSCEMEV